MSAKKRVTRSLDVALSRFSGLREEVGVIGCYQDDAHLLTMTACTDGHHIFFSKPYVDGLTDEELDSVVMHELLHILDDHINRVGRRNWGMWNIACDLKNNGVLHQTEMPLPHGYPFNKDYIGMEPEQIYDLVFNRSGKKAIKGKLHKQRR